VKIDNSCTKTRPQCVHNFNLVLFRVNRHVKRVEMKRSPARTHGAPAVSVCRVSERVLSERDREGVE
jgi:hypothetical protein